VLNCREDDDKVTGIGRLDGAPGLDLVKVEHLFEANS
jgi:hypothetical protein